MACGAAILPVNSLVSTVAVPLLLVTLMSLGCKARRGDEFESGASCKRLRGTGQASCKHLLGAGNSHGGQERLAIHFARVVER